jgi:hypothetical protein
MAAGPSADPVDAGYLDPASVLPRPRRALASLARLRRTAGSDALMTMGMVTLVLAPLLFTRSGFALDFTNYLWLIWVAGKTLVAAGHPDYFLNVNGMGVFYPWLAFEGGTLFTLTGGLSELLGGHAEIAFATITAAAVAGDYAGALWLGRQFGLRGWLAHAPAITIVTSAYYITNLYGRGAWDEFIAVAALAPLLASAVYLVRTNAWHPWAMFVLVASTTILTGSHNLTLVWAPSMAALALLTIWLALGAPRQLPYRRLAMVAGLGGLGVLVNAWYLLTDASYQQFVVAHSATPQPGVSVWSGTGFFNTPGVLLDPFRIVPHQSSTPALYVQAPVWLLAWSAVTGGLLLWRRRMRPRLRRLWIAAAVLVLLLLFMIMVKQVWAVVPFPYDEIQFPYRLGSYLFYAIAGLVLVSALALERVTDERARRMTVGLRLGLVGVCLVSVGLCVWQQWVPSTLFANSYLNRGEALTEASSLPRTWYDGGSYADQQAPLVAVPHERLLFIEPDLVHGDHFAAWVDAPEGPQPIQTNINGGQYLVHISGVRRIGRDKQGYVVVRREPGSRGPVHLVLETTHSFVIELGRALSIAAIAILLALFAITGVRRSRERRRSRALNKRASAPLV